MATTKSYTDLSQSKVLAEILPLESADMCYRVVAYNPEDTHVYQPYCFVGTLESDIPCWSLSGLLGVLNKSAYFVNEAGIVELSSIKATKWCICILNCGKIGNCYADNPIDACVAMIEKLNELKML